MTAAGVIGGVLGNAPAAIQLVDMTAMRGQHLCRAAGVQKHSIRLDLAEFDGCFDHNARLDGTRRFVC
jgi:hypothetical protein